MAGINAVLKALSNPSRRRVYQLICRAARQKKGITIEALCKATGFKQPSVSHHVSRLADAGLVVRRRARWWVHCLPAGDGLDVLGQFVKNPAVFPTDTAGL